MKRGWNVALVLLVVHFGAVALSAQILDLAELNTEQIRALDRQKTVVIISGRILEEHGPYLPSYFPSQKY
jgi:hypothetical protein